MSYNSSDDGVEFFGGQFNLRNLIVVGAEDDSLDTDTGVKVDMQNVIAIQRPGVGDTIIEADSSNGLEEDTPRQNTRISNATFIANSGTGDQAIRIRGFADYTIVNSVLVDNEGSTPCLRIDNPETLNRAANGAIDEAGPVVFNSFVLDCATDFRDGSGGVTAAQIADPLQRRFEQRCQFHQYAVDGLRKRNQRERCRRVRTDRDLVVLPDPDQYRRRLSGQRHLDPGLDLQLGHGDLRHATVSDCTSLPVYPDPQSDGGGRAYAVPRPFSSPSHRAGSQGSSTVLK